MHRLRQALAIVPALILPSTVLAQSGAATGGASSNQMIIKYGSETQTNVINALRIGGPDCEDDITITMAVDPTGSTTNLQNKTLQLWRSNNEVNCSDPANRMNQNGCDGAQCTLVTSTATTSSDFSIEAKAKALFGTDGGECPASSVVRIAMVFVSSTDENCTSAASDTTEGKYYADFSVRNMDAVQPTNVTARDGDASFSVSWKPGSGGQSTDTYVVMSAPVDGLDGGGSCPPLFTGDAPPTSDEIDAIPGIVTKDTSNPNTTLKTESLGLKYGEQASVAVFAEDLWGNRSLVSNSSCAKRIMSSGLVGAYEEETGKTVKTCSSTSAPRDGGGTAWMGLGLLLLGALGVRRARSAS